MKKSIFAAGLIDMNKVGILFLLHLCYFFLPVKGQAIDLSLFLDTVQIRHYAPMRSMTRIKVDPSDSIYVEKYGEMRYYNSDTLFHYLATRGYHAVEDELYYYYYDIVSYMRMSGPQPRSGKPDKWLSVTITRR